MNRNSGLRAFVTAALCTVAVVFLATRLIGQVVSLDPAKMPALARSMSASSPTTLKWWK